MSGEFFTPPRPEAPHTCPLPRIRVLTPEGWRCDCGRAYVLEELTQHGESWSQWRRAPEHDA